MNSNDPDRDPFSERSASRWSAQHRLLGGRFRFVTNSRPLLRLINAAYRDLPPQTLRTPAPRFDLELRLGARSSLGDARVPPPLEPFSGAGLFGGILNATNFALLSPATRSGLITVSRDLLSLPYHLRYELLEFAVCTLASRAQGLLSLHAACVGHAGRGLLLMGSGGAGKSTLALHCALQGMEFLAEDAAFVDPVRMLVTGVPNFVHVRADAVASIEHLALAARVRAAPMIKRRSGVRKFEVDLRPLGCRLARRPLRLAGVVFLSSRRAGAAAQLLPLSRERLQQRFVAAQGYATLLPGWGSFRRQFDRLPGYELRRGQHPSESAVALRHLLG